MKKHTLHTHTTYSDGQLCPEELVDELADRNYQVVGITDHGFSRAVKSINKLTLPRYIEHLQRLKQQEKRLELKVGLEVDLSLDDGIDPEHLQFDYLNQLDYILFEAGGLENDNLYRGVKPIARIRNRLSIPVGLAHYDLYNIYMSIKSTEEVVKLLAENDIFFELNTSHDMDYLPKDLIQLFRMLNISFTVGTDLHGRSRLDENVDSVHNYIAENGLKPHYFIA